jgi:hypothetical protein
MTEEEIIDGNKLIAEFMGYYLRENFRGRSFWWHSADSKTWGKGTWTPAFELEHECYHEDWNWLIPVWSKINSDLYIDMDKVHNFNQETHIPQQFADSIVDNNPQRGFEVVLQAIEWSNQYK